jgi:hypothetical protein
MPYYRVTVRGDPTRASGLLGLAGIENVVAGPRDPHAPGRTLIARLPADNGELAVQRVRAALMDDAFNVDDYARQEP